MIKRTSLVWKRRDISDADFRSAWLGEHADYARRLPGLREYVVDFVNEGPSGGPAGIATLRFDTRETLEAAFSTPGLKEELLRYARTFRRSRGDPLRRRVRRRRSADGRPAMSASDPTRHSRPVLSGPERAGARAMLRALGKTDGDFSKPQIGVAATWNNVTPCNAGLDKLRRVAAEHLDQAGVVAYEFDTIAVSDGISMGAEGMRASLVSRDWIANSVELVVRAQGYDGFLGIAGCDKSIPGMLLAIVRMKVPAVFAYGGSLAPGTLDGHDISLQDVYEAVGAYTSGQIDAARLKAVEMVACPGVGHLCWHVLRQYHGGRRAKRSA